jgi:TP901 family phage tail tape measure protein
MNELIVQLQAELNKVKSKGKINGDIQIIQEKLDKLKLETELDPKSISKITKQLEKMLNQKINVSNINIDSKVGQQIANTISKNIEEGITKASSNKYNKMLTSTKSNNSAQQKFTKTNAIGEPNQNNSKTIQKAIATNNAYKDSLQNLNLQMSQMDYDALTKNFKENENSMHGISRLGALLRKQFAEAAQEFSQWLSISSAVTFAISKTKDAILEIKELDGILTNISKTSNMTSGQLKQLGKDAYSSASKYGKTASDYLNSIQAMSNSGFQGKKGTAMAEQSLMAQAAGDMSAELANNYIIAANSAYKLNGEASKLNAILDGQNSITNKNSVAMVDMAEGMLKTATIASEYKVSVEDLSAMIGTIQSISKSGGSEVGDAIQSILINLQNVSSDKITGTLDKANASMTETVNGVSKLRNPIAILRDLAKTFNLLDDNAPLKEEILSNIGGEDHAAKLSALLQNMEMFDKMLIDYSTGSGSALESANKSATNLTGTFNKLSNSWNELVNSLVNSDGLKFGVSLLDSLVQGATKLVSVLTPLGTIGVGAGLFTGFKNTGKCRISVRIS